MYKYDREACAKHIAAKEGSSYHTMEKLDTRHKERNIHCQSIASYDELAQHGLPDRQCYFEQSTSLRYKRWSKH